MRKKGSTVAVAFILGIVFFIAVSALLHHSSGEMKHVKSISAVKKAELLAMSGIDWAEAQLRKERWYGTDFEPYKMNKGKHATSGIKKLTPFGDGEGKVTVVCEDVANKIPGENVHGMQQLWYLHHINVYALGEFENQSCLMYGRYIISPEPILNSKSTEGADFIVPEFGEVGRVGVFVPTATVNGENVSDFKVKEIKVSAYDKVDGNSIVAILSPANNPDAEIKVKPTTFGRVDEIRCNVGDSCKVGDSIVLLKKEIEVGDDVVAHQTLKKMVRVTKIPLEIWKTLDIEDRNDRFTLSQYIAGLSDAYLQNFVAHASLNDSLKEIGEQKYDEKLSSADVLRLFPAHITSTTKNRAENTFLAHMIKNFTAPGGTWEQKEKALDKTILLLDQPKTNQPPAELVDFLRELNLTHLLVTKPRSDNRYYELKLKNDEFMDLLQPHLNEPPTDFIKTLSELPDAARNCDIQEADSLNEYVNKETDESIEITLPDKGVKVVVDKYKKDYTFVDPENGFAIEMNDLMAFLKKYYDDSDSLSPREEIRNNEHIDWPLPEPAPAPPAEVPGGTWVWEPGEPGVPPGEPVYIDNGGGIKEIDPPTAGSGGFEPNEFGDPDGGKKEWKVEGEPGDGKGDGSGDGNPKENGNPGKIKVCDCNGGNCNKCNPQDSEKIKVNVGTEWEVKPGTEGKEPSQGKYVWQENNNANDDGSSGSDGNDGSASGTGNGDNGESEAPSGSGGTGGSGTSTPTGGTSAPSAPSTPSRSYRHVSGCY